VRKLKDSAAIMAVAMPTTNAVGREGRPAGRWFAKAMAGGRVPAHLRIAAAGWKCARLRSSARAGVPRDAHAALPAADGTRSGRAVVG
jgi:hypothetical protein